MKRFTFLHASAIAVSMAFLFISCNSGGEKQTEATTTETTAADTSTAMKAPEPAPSVPSNALILKFKVANFEKWKTSYDANDSFRRAAGLTNYIVGRGTSDPNMAVVILKMTDVNKAKEMTASTGMKERMHKAGVIGAPSVQFLDVVMNDTTPIDQKARLMVTHKVKDWDTWKKSFDSHKQARMDAGLIDRGLGYSDGDNHTVSIVFAVTDKKKADDFSKSKDLKDKMAEAGVEGPPTFFYYDIVQKY